MKQLLSICLLLLLMTGCKERPEVIATLDRADALMESTPDSALTLLQTLDAETFRKRSTYARHALLFTQAQDKNYIDETNDSLISIAVDHYRHHGDVRHRFLSLYYKGRVQTNAGDHLKAMLSYAEAEELVQELNDDYYAGLLYSQMGDAYGEYYDFPKSLEAYQKAENYFKSANKDYHGLFALTDQSTIYRNMNEYSKSDSLLQNVLVEAKQMNSHSLIDYVLGCLMMQYVEQKRMDEAKLVYDELQSIYGIDNNTSDFMYSAIKLHLSENKIEEAERLLIKAWTQATTANDSIACHLAASQIYKTAGLLEYAMKEHEAGVLIQNRLMSENLQQPILTMQRDLLEKELEHEAYRRRMNFIFGIVVFISLIILALVAIYFIQQTLRKHYRKSLHRRLKQQDVENRRIMEKLWEEAMLREHSIYQHIEKLNQEMLQKDKASIEHIKILKEELNKQGEILLQYKIENEALTDASDKECQKWKEFSFMSFHNHLMFLEDIFDAYFYKDYFNDSSRNSNISDVLYKYGKGYITFKEGKRCDKLEEMVNLYMNNVMTHFREEVKFPKNEDHYNLVCFLFAGFSINFISNLMGCTPNAVYKRKKEIIRKIEKINPSHSEEYLNYIRK